MDNQKEIKLSSNWTNVGLYGGSLLLLFMVPILVLVIMEQKFHMGMVVAGIAFLGLIGFLIYLFMYTCDARIIGDKIVLKKQFRPTKEYSFDKIGYPTSFRLKRTKYITVEMKNDDNTTEKFIIMNSRSLLSFENKDAEQVLISLRNLAGKK
ncbi:hypothetical protein L0P88_17950 [Muricauda sp. SCSIO 64092]|uniref:hypothetical protein n=1 Tax=Allomuricauda sp. SCSIO 64092 TaxID=2908842 RepID=UPI001FF29D9D|nr:hypothetical protein [Muricauda sp. SCSIO 64092]UOY05811.1 hypothetical protein L0P88_17950 [Muricauda sp. SCSIO 64092]